MLIFVLSISLNVNRNLTVAVGSVSSIKNPFASQRIPAFQYCDDDNYPMNYEYTFNERKTIIPFPNELDMSHTVDTNIIHCKQILTKKQINIFKANSKDGNFLRFYIGHTVQRVIFFKNDEDIKIFTNFLFIIDNSKNTSSPLTRIVPRNPVSLKEGNEISISFTCSFSSSLNTNNFSIKVDRFSQIYIISFVLILISIIISVVFYCNNKDSHVIPLSEIWRLPEDIGNTFLFVIFGLIMMSLGIFFYLLKKDSDDYGSYFEKLLFPSLIIPITIYTLISRILGIDADLPNWMAPCIVYYICFIGIPHAYTVLFGIFGSFRGFRIRRIAFWDPLFLGLTLVFVRGAGPAAALLEPPRVVDAKSGPSSLNTRGTKFISKLFDMIYVFLSVMILIPLSSHLIEVFIDDHLVDGELIGCYSVLFASTACMFGLIHSLGKTQYVSTTPWSSGLMRPNILVGLFEVGYVVYQWVLKREMYHIQAVTMVAVLVSPYLLTIVGVGTAIFYLAPFVPILLAFSQPKTN